MLPINLEERVISLYNSEEKKLIGIFSSIALASKFLYGNNNNYQKLYGHLRFKSKCKENNLKCSVAVRYASPNQIEQLVENEFLVDEKYDEHTKRILFNFDMTRYDLYKKCYNNISNFK